MGSEGCKMSMSRGFLGGCKTDIMMMMIIIIIADKKMGYARLPSRLNLSGTASKKTLTPSISTAGRRVCLWGTQCSDSHTVTPSPA